MTKRSTMRPAKRTKQPLEWTNCSACGEAFQRARSEIMKSRRKGHNLYCPECQPHRKSAGKKKKRPVGCGVCGAVVYRNPHHIMQTKKDGKTITCSKACAGALYNPADEKPKERENRPIDLSKRFRTRNGYPATFIKKSDRKIDKPTPLYFELDFGDGEKAIHRYREDGFWLPTCKPFEFDLFPED